LWNLAPSAGDHARQETFIPSDVSEETAVPGNPPLNPVDERELSTQLALLALERAAPDELLMFDELKDEYFEDPAATLAFKKREEAVGFGLELALLTPYAIAVAQFVLGLLVDVLMDGVKDAAKPGVAGMLRRLLRLPSQESPTSPPPELTPEQRQRIFAAARAEAQRLGLSNDHSTLLGNAVVGALTDSQA
jgi:hypothetical protein